MKPPLTEHKQDMSAPITPEMMARDAFEIQAQKKAYKYWLIFNPAANKGRAKSQLEQVKAMLLKQQEASTIQLTTKREEATHFSQLAKTKSEVIVACGGDGTVNEVAQSLVGTEISLAILPIGSGNDFFKNLSTKKKLSDAFRLLIRGKARKIDVGKVTFCSNSQTYTRYFFNSLGLGFTGAIAKEASVSKCRGELVYLDALRKVGKTYSATPMQLSLDTPQGTKQVAESIFALTIGNGKVEGGKFKIAPDATLDDGLLDLCALIAFPKWKLPLWVMRYIRGSHVQSKGIHYQKISSATILLTQPLNLHLDGEVFENVSGQLLIECLPNALTVIAE